MYCSFFLCLVFCTYTYPIVLIPRSYSLLSCLTDLISWAENQVYTTENCSVQLWGLFLGLFLFFTNLTLSLFCRLLPSCHHRVSLPPSSRWQCVDFRLALWAVTSTPLQSSSEQELPQWEWLDLELGLEQCSVALLLDMPGRWITCHTGFFVNLPQEGNVFAHVYQHSGRKT